MTTASYKQRVAAGFDLRGDSYDTSLFHRELAKRLLELVELQPGQHVLDVATGTGLVAIPAAQLVGEKGGVIGVDISEGMLQQARKVSAELGLTNLAFEQADADTMELGSGRFDVILCCSALIYLTDIPRALESWHTALKPDGQIAFTCFADTAFLVPALLREYAADYGVSLPSPNAPCGSLERCQELVETAGFRQPKVYTESFTYHWRLNRAEDAWPERPRSPFTEGINQLDEQDLQGLKQRYTAGIERLIPEGELQEQVPTFFVLAHK